MEENCNVLVTALQPLIKPFKWNSVVQGEDRKFSAATAGGKSLKVP